MSKTIGIVGMGNMGRGIAEVAALSGLRTILCKATPGDARIGRCAIEASLDRAFEKGKISEADRDAALDRLVTTSDRDRLLDADLVIESVVEDLPEKLSIFSDLEARLGPDVVLATNTSALSLSALAAGLSSPARFVGLHFFSPVSAMKLVEIAAPRTTAPSTIRTAEAIVASLGKTPVRCSDTPGFIVNRLLMPYLLDAMRVLERGIASAAAIDTAMKLGCGHPMGPLQLADAVGLDVVLAIAESLALEVPHATPPRILRELVARGHLGKKSGLGLWDYSADPPVPNAAIRPTSRAEPAHLSP